MLFAVIVVGLYLGGEKGEIESEGVKREVRKVENIYRRDDFYKESSTDNPHKEESTDASYGVGSVVDRLPKDVSESDEEKLKPDFYGEKLLFVGPAEDAFEIIVDEGEFRMIRYRTGGEEKVDPSIYSYALFDSVSLNRLSIDLYNMSLLPIEMDYHNDRYYLEDYAGNIYQMKVDMKQGDYNKAINLQEGKTILVKYPPSIPEANIKNIIIKLKKREIVVGLQRLPDILY